MPWPCANHSNWESSASTSPMRVELRPKTARSMSSSTTTERPCRSRALAPKLRAPTPLRTQGVTFTPLPSRVKKE
eukprot:6753024-Prymnesium_polylepis.1